MAEHKVSCILTGASGRPRAAPSSPFCLHVTFAAELTLCTSGPCIVHLLQHVTCSIKFKKNVGRKKLTGLGRRMAQIRTQAVNAVYMRPPHRMNLKHKNRKKSRENFGSDPTGEFESRFQRAYYGYAIRASGLWG